MSQCELSQQLAVNPLSWGGDIIQHYDGGFSPVTWKTEFTDVLLTDNLGGCDSQ